ncbi:MAG: ATPase [Firmicutes bacterium]|nr:ATPase [Bacillota bacterium]MCL5038319.1 ATPase [Bacillota bacterium]
MEVLELMEQLEHLLETSHRIPLTSRVLVDEDEAFAILDEIRRQMPADLEQARRIQLEREQILAQAREEAEGILQEARNQVTRLIDEATITRQAREQADRLVEQGRALAREMKQGAAEYADDILKRLEENVTKALEVIRSGREELRLPGGRSESEKGT